MKPAICFFNVAMSILGTVQAQDAIVMFDQPGVTTSPYIVPQNSIQFEFGTSYNSITGLNETIFPSLLTRVPVADRTEIRLTINYEPQSNIFILDDVSHNNDPLALGFKQNLFYGNKILPKISVVGNVFYPIQKLNQIQTTEICADAWLLGQNAIGRRYELIYNVGFIHGNERLRDIMSWACCYGIMLTENVCLFGEYYGYHYFESNITEHGFDFGATYEFGNRFQLDACYYYNMDPAQKMGYISGGISYNYRRNSPINKTPVNINN